MVRIYRSYDGAFTDRKPKSRPFQQKLTFWRRNVLVSFTLERLSLSLRL